MAKHFENPDGPENVENVDNVEKAGKTEGKEKEGILSKAKNFFAEHIKSKESEKSDDSKEKSDGGKEKDTMEDRRQAFLDSLKVESKDSEIAKQYREKHGMDENGGKIDKQKKSDASDDETDDSDHGDDGERTRDSDARYARMHENRERDDDEER